MAKSRIFTTVEDVYAAINEGAKIEDKYSYSHPIKTGGKTLNVSLGRIWWNLLLPNDFEFINEPVNSKKINEIIKKIKDIMSPNDASELLTKINKEAFYIGTYAPTTFSIDSVILSDDIKRQKKEFQRENVTEPIEYSEKVDRISKNIANELNLKDVRINNIKESGAKDIPWGPLMVSYGYVSDIENQVLGPIKTAINDGHDPRDFYKTAAEARKGFFYKAAISSKPGYLARRVTMANAHIQIDDSIKDCGTKKTFKILIDKDLAGDIKNRYYIKNTKPSLITNPEELIGQTIELRSPLYCKSIKGICPICYGTSWSELNNKNIGVLAGGNVNNKALNTCATRSIVKSYSM